MKDTACFS